MKSQESIINIYTYSKHITLYTPFNLVASSKLCMLEMELCRIITFTKICFFSSHTLHYIQYKTFRFLLDNTKRGDIVPWIADNRKHGWLFLMPSVRYYPKNPIPKSPFRTSSTGRILAAVRSTPISRPKMICWKKCVTNFSTTSSTAS